jgi:hypothetical protein
MKRTALVLLLLLGGSAVQAQDLMVDRVCDVEVREPSDLWNADRYSVRWTHWLPDRASVAIYSHIYDEHDRYHFEEEGAFSRWSNNSFIVSPKTRRTNGRLWARLAAGERVLAPQEVSRSKGFYGIARFKADEVHAMIEGAEELTVTFYDQKQAVIEQFTVPRPTIETGAARMGSVYQEYRTRLAEPETRCGSEIIFNP